MDNVNYGIVFSGGGALGAWEVGAYRAIRANHNDRPPLVVTGSSAGAINASGVCAGMHAQQLVDLWSNMTNDTVYVSTLGSLTLLGSCWHAVTGGSLARAAMRFLKTRLSIFDTSPLEKTLRQTFSGYYNTFTQSPTRCALAVSNLIENKSQLFYKLPTGESLPADAEAGRLKGTWKLIAGQDMLIQALMGSTALPILFPPFAGYFDGGVLLNQPISPAIALGVHRIYVIIPSTQALGMTRNLLEIGSTVLTTWLSASLVQQIDNVRLRNTIRKFAGDPLIELCVIRPPQDITQSLGVSLLSFGKAVPRMVQEGENAARARLDRFVPGNENTWY